MSNSTKPKPIEFIMGSLVLIGMIVPLVDWFKHPEYNLVMVFQEWKWVILGTLLLALIVKFRGFGR